MNNKLKDEKELKLINSYIVATRKTSEARVLLHNLDNTVIFELLDASFAPISKKPNVVKNILFYNLLFRQRDREIKYLKNEISKIFKTINSLSLIEKECLRNYIENGYSSHFKLKYIRKLFVSKLRKLDRIKSKKAYFNSKNISLKYLISFYVEHEENIEENFIFLPDSYINNIEALNLLIPIFRKTSMEINEIILMYTRARYGKFSIKDKEWKQ